MGDISEAVLGDWVCGVRARGCEPEGRMMELPSCEGRRFVGQPSGGRSSIPHVSVPHGERASRRQDGSVRPRVSREAQCCCIEMGSEVQLEDVTCTMT